MRDAALSFAFFAGQTLVLVVVVRKLPDSTFWPSRRKFLVASPCARPTEQSRQLRSSSRDRCAEGVSRSELPLGARLSQSGRLVISGGLKGVRDRAVVRASALQVVIAPGDAELSIRAVAGAGSRPPQRARAEMMSASPIAALRKMTPYTPDVSWSSAG